MLSPKRVGFVKFQFVGKTTQMLRSLTSRTVTQNFTRSYSQLQKARAATRAELQPSEHVPDVEAFLSKIGRNMKQHSGQFETWNDLVSVSSKDLKEKGIDTRDRRYLLGWLERYKNGADLETYNRGTKKWGGERNRRAERAAFFGRKKAEERK